MSLDLAVMWFFSLLTAALYGQLAVVSACIIYKFHAIASRRDMFESAALGFWSVICITTQLVSSGRGLVSYQGLGLKVAMILVVWGVGKFALAAQERRNLWLMFCKQERDRAAEVD